MTRFISGALTAATAIVFAYIYGPELLEKLFRRGDSSEFGDVCKQPTFRQMTGRLPNE